MEENKTESLLWFFDFKYQKGGNKEHVEKQREALRRQKKREEYK